MVNEPKNTRKKANQPAHATQGFGVPLTAAPHHFVVIIPRGNKQPVQIVEDLGMHTIQPTIREPRKAGKPDADENIYETLPLFQN